MSSRIRWCQLDQRFGEIGSPNRSRRSEFGWQWPAASARPRDRRATDGIEADKSMLSRFFSAGESASRKCQVRQRIGLPPKFLSALGIVFLPQKRLGGALIFLDTPGRRRQ